jgi:hypothetical protein
MVEIVLVWALGFFITGIWFAKQGIGPWDNYFLPAVAATLWPVWFPVYLMVRRIRSRRPRGNHVSK